MIAVSRSPAPLDELKKEYSNIKTIAVDLSDWKATRDALSAINEEEIHGLVNNAGIAIIKPYDELTEKDYDDLFNVNLKAIFNVSQTLAKRMKAGASIVNVSSLASLAAFPGHSLYSASKSAVDSLTRSMALEYGTRNIRCNSVNPTVILTRMGIENWSDPVKADPIKALIPLHRFGQVDEVVDPVCYLLSDKSSFITGHCLPIDGGYTAC